MARGAESADASVKRAKTSCRVAGFALLRVAAVPASRLWLVAGIRPAPPRKKIKLRRPPARPSEGARAGGGGGTSRALPPAERAPNHLSNSTGSTRGRRSSTKSTGTRRTSRSSSSTGSTKRRTSTGKRTTSTRRSTTGRSTRTSSTESTTRCQGGTCDP